MQLCVDVGNTFTKIAVFKNREIKHFSRSSLFGVDELDEILMLYPIHHIIYSSSGEDQESLIERIRKFKEHTILDYTTPMPINILYETPETLGKDRIAAVMGGFSLFPGENLAVIDMGTCITYDMLTKTGDYLGGNISPGAKMRLQAMHEYTDKLPLVEMGNVDNWIGVSTETALRNGAILGTILEVESFLARAKAEFGDIRTILTGGDADFFVDKINSEIFVDQYLVHRGLNEIIKHNEHN